MSSLKQSKLQDAIGITIAVTGAVAVAFAGITWYFVWRRRRTGSSDVSSAE